MWQKLLLNIVTLGIPKIIESIAAARRKKREQEERMKRVDAVLEKAERIKK